MYRTYLSILFIGGLIAAVTGTLLSGGGGWTLAVLGCVAIGAGLVLVGQSLKSDGAARLEAGAERIQR